MAEGIRVTNSPAPHHGWLPDASGLASERASWQADGTPVRPFPSPPPHEAR
ncbi:MAG: hypothetical protein NZM07_06580 [Elioraea sp.]|nr:hypothetical protein [Elioraea sp.]